MMLLKPRDMYLCRREEKATKKSFSFTIVLETEREAKALRDIAEYATAASELDQEAIDLATRLLGQFDDAEAPEPHDEVEVVPANQNAPKPSDVELRQSQTTPPATVAGTRDKIIWRPDLQKRLGVSSETLRRWIVAKKIPPPDVALSARTMGWKPTTLQTAGIDFLLEP